MATATLNTTDHPTLQRVVTTERFGRPLVVIGTQAVNDTQANILRDLPLRNGKPTVKVT